MIRLRVDPLAPNREAMAQAAAVIRGGGLVIVPTDTLYGLAVSPFNPAAVSRLFAVKGRDASQALPLIAADFAQVFEAVGSLPAAALVLAGQFWPGPLTIIVPSPPTIVAQVAGGTGRIGIRVPHQKVATELCRLSGTMLTATSANLSGQPASADPDDVATGLGAMTASIDVLLDAGRTAGGRPSTIVDASEGPVRLVREGAIPWESIQPWL